MEEALSIDISSYLQNIGLRPAKETTRYLYYNSPLPGRSDPKPSFVVNKSTNRWCDYGVSRESDRIVKLVCIIEDCSLTEAVDILLKDKGVSVRKFDKRKKKAKGKDIRVVKVRHQFGDMLFKYLCRRKIPLPLARKYCKQVDVIFPNSKVPKRVFEFIGFKNNLGGYELRSPSLKISLSPKYYTIIGKGKKRYVFEGFMDYLSFMAYRNEDKIEGMAIILNSITLIPWVYDILKSDGENHLFFDNDKAADKEMEKLKEEKIKFRDHRRTYRMYKDLNKFLCNDIMQ